MMGSSAMSELSQDTTRLVEYILSDLKVVPNPDNPKRGIELDACDSYPSLGDLCRVFVRLLNSDLPADEKRENLFSSLSNSAYEFLIAPPWPREKWSDAVKGLQQLLEPFWKQLADLAGTKIGKNDGRWTLLTERNVLPSWDRAQKNAVYEIERFYGPWRNDATHNAPLETIHDLAMAFACTVGLYLITVRDHYGLLRNLLFTPGELALESQGGRDAYLRAIAGSEEMHSPYVPRQCRPNSQTPARSAVEALDEFVHSGSLLLRLEGSAWSGKTWLLEHFASQLARGRVSGTTHQIVVMPVFLHAPECSRSRFGLNIVAALDGTGWYGLSELAPEQVLLASGTHWVLLCDHLDQAPNPREILGDIYACGQQWLQQGIHLSIVVSYRSGTLPRVTRPPGKRLELLPIDLALEGKITNFFDSHFLSWLENHELSSMACVPFWLAGFRKYWIENCNMDSLEGPEPAYDTGTSFEPIRVFDYVMSDTMPGYGTAPDMRGNGQDDLDRVMLNLGRIAIEMGEARQLDIDRAREVVGGNGTPIEMLLQYGLLQRQGRRLRCCDERFQDYSAACSLLATCGSEDLDSHAEARINDPRYALVCTSIAQALIEFRNRSSGGEWAA